MENKENTMITTDNQNALLVSNTSEVQYTSWCPTTFDEKKVFYNAISNPTEKLGDKINMTIDVRHVYAESCEYRNQETGEVQPGVRIVLIEEDGKSYNTSSIGVYRSLTKIFTIFGTPDTWESPIKLFVKQVTPSKDRKILTLEVV